MRGRVALIGLLFAGVAIAEDAAVTVASSSGKTTHRVPRAESAVKLDGSLDEAAWSRALELELPYETTPGDNIPASVETSCKLLYDDDHLFVGCNAIDPEPNAIRARLSDRDRAFQDDFVGIVLDTFNDERRAFEFFVNPLGVQMDMVMDDVQGNEDSSWDAIWDSAGKVHETGYSVEMAIPFSSLRFQRGDGDQTWGIDMLRIYPRDARYRMGLNRLERDMSCYLCQTQKIVGFASASPGKNLEITPTLTGVRTEGLPGNGPNGELVEQDESYEPGLTARWGITPNLTLSGTLNPDFSQVEADSARLDVNESFTLFFPEKRPFFLEGSDYFDTPLSAVYTRQVSNPNWGVKLTGKEGPNTMGLFIAEDDQTTFIRPGLEGSRVGALDEKSYDLATRYRRDLGEKSSVGFIGTLRTAEDSDYDNAVVGVDALVRPGDVQTIRLQYLRSDTTDLGIGLDGESGDAWFASYRYSPENYTLRASHNSRDANFRADLGFIPRVDFEQTVVGGEYRWYGDDAGWFNRISLGGDWDQTHDSAGEFVEREAELFFTYSGPQQSFTFFGLGERNRRFNGFDFDQEFISGFFEMRPSSMIYFNFDIGYRDQIDFGYQPTFGEARQGKQFNFSPGINVRPGRHVELRLDHTYRRLDLENDGGRLFEVDLTELRFVYQFNVRTFIRLITQFEDLQRMGEVEPRKEWFNQMLFSYKINPQTALFLGYSDRRRDTFDFDEDGDGFVDTVNTDLTTDSRTFFVKLGYAWVPK